MVSQRNASGGSHARRASILLVTTGASIAAMLTIFAPSGGNAAVGAAGAENCTLNNLIATIRIGPDRGFALAGSANLHIASSGGISGSLVQPNRAPGTVVGQANGRAINLVFSLADHRQVFSTGTLVNDIRACQGLMRGPVVGPRQGDIGDWAGVGRTPQDIQKPGH
ncbi:MAG: hypothetical protein QOH12_1835 [Solirubrobacteraceae bacterium]|jgi:hypothetical protein|nr:hypothetical protein [Solirubrobacteraceae bacterium]